MQIFFKFITIFILIFFNYWIVNTYQYQSKKPFIEKKDSYELYSPFDWKIEYFKTYSKIYNKDKSIVIKLKTTQINFNTYIIEKNKSFGVFNSNNLPLEVYINWIKQNSYINRIFLEFLLWNNYYLQNIDKSSIKINNRKLLDFFKNKHYFDEDYQNFFSKLNQTSKYSLISENDLFLWKIITEDKFIDIVDNYKNKKLSIDKLNNEDKKTYFKIKEYIEYINTGIPDKEKDIKYKDIEYKIVWVINKIYNKFYIPEDKYYLKNVVNYNDEKEDVLAQFKMWNTLHNSMKVYNWKIKSYADKNIDKEYFLSLSAINNMECRRSDGACFNWADAWPFQINRMAHEYDFKKSKKLVDMIKLEKNENERNKLKYELFDYQLDWTISRLDRLKPKFCQWKTGDNLTRCLAILHNGNNSKTCYMNGQYVEHKYCYAEWVIKIKRIIEQSYWL